VKIILSEVLNLLTQAAGEAAEVRAVGETDVSISTGRGKPFRWRLASPEAPDTDSPHPIMWVLRRPSVAEMERRRRSGQSFVALNGAVRVQGPGLLIDRENLRPPKTFSKGVSSRSAFSDRASLVPRFLFAGGPEKEWSVSGLAEGTGLSPSGTSYALDDLVERGIVVVRKAGRQKMVRLPSRRALIEEWSREYHWRENRSVSVLAPVGIPERFLRRIGEEMTTRGWAATLHAGATLLVRHGLVEEVHLYVDAESEVELQAVAWEAGWEVGEGGALRLLLPRYPRSVWQGVTLVGGVPVVSPLQLILDLWNHPLRGLEQAEAILENLENESHVG